MRRLFLAALAFALPLHAQTRVLVGSDAGYLFDNAYVGLYGGVEVPIERIELDAYGSFDPVESHVHLGHGYAASGQGQGILWLSRRVGLAGEMDYSVYRVAIRKSAEYAFAGAVINGSIDGSPTRFLVSYVREFNNGIAADGTETAHLSGVRFRYESRLGCRGRACFQLNQEFWGGHVLTQGNPICDGTYGVTGGPNGGPCPRTGAVSGGVDTSFVVYRLGRREEK